MEKYYKDFFGILRDNIYTVLTGKFQEGKTDLNTLGNFALMRAARRQLYLGLKHTPPLTREQKKEIRKFYAPYIRHLSDSYHRIYTHASQGHFCPEYIPEDLFYMDIDRYYSNREEARYLDNKCYYYRLLSNVKQPDLIAMRVGESWLDQQMEQVSFEKVVELIGLEQETVVKRAVNSEGGFGITFLTGDEKDSDFRKLVVTIPCDIVIQRPVRQHPLMSELHPSSVNTLRILSLLEQDKVKIYGTVIRIGTGDNRVDNVSHGGIFCGVQEDGNLGEYGVLYDGSVTTHHPDMAYAFADKKIPGLEKAHQLVRKAHPFLGHFRLASWDIAIDEKGEAVLIEVNLSLGGVSEMQICTGSLFGEDTKKILDEVYHERRKWTTLL